MITVYEEQRKGAVKSIKQTKFILKTALVGKEITYERCVDGEIKGFPLSGR